MTLRKLSSADTVEYLWICYSSLLLYRLKCCLLIFQKIIQNCLWVGLSSLSSRDHAPQFPQRPSSHGCVSGGRLHDIILVNLSSCHTYNIIFVPGVLSCYLFESTLTFLLFKCQFNWFPSSETIIIPMNQTSLDCFPALPLVHKQSRLLYKPASSLKPSPS